MENAQKSVSNFKNTEETVFPVSPIKFLVFHSITATDTAMDTDIECGLLGQPISFDEEAKLAFYSGLMCNNTEIFVGDCVQLEIDADTDYQQGRHIVSDTTDTAAVGSTAYGQVLAIFASKDIVSSADMSQGEMVEIRWFHTAAELESLFFGKKKRQ